MRFLDLCVLEVEIPFLADHPLIANFIGPKPKIGCVEALNTEIENGQVSFNQEAGFGFFLCEMQFSKNHNTSSNANPVPQ